MEKDLSKALREDILKTIDPSYFTEKDKNDLLNLDKIVNEKSSAVGIVLRLSTLRALFEELGVLEKRSLIK